MEDDRDTSGSEVTPEMVLGFLDDKPAGDTLPVGDKPAEESVSDGGDKLAAETVVSPPVEKPVEGEKPAVEPVKGLEAEQEALNKEFADDEFGSPRVVIYEGEKEFHFPEQRARTLIGLAREARQYKDIAPTLEEAETHRGIYVDQVAMHADFRSGDPNRVSRFFNYWSKQSPEGLAAVADPFVDHIKAQGPQVYERLQSRVLGETRDEIYRQYAGHADKKSDEAQTLLFAAQFLDWKLTGKFTPAEGVPKPDPIADRVADIERREAALRRSTQDQESGARSTFRRNLQSEIYQKVEGEIEESLKPIGHLKKSHSRLYGAAVKEIRESIKTALQSDKAWTQLYLLQLEKAETMRDDATRKELVTFVLNRAKRAISPSTKAGVIAEFGSAAKAESESAHDQHKKSNAEKEVTGGMAPKGQPVATTAYDKAKKEKNLAGMIEAITGR